MARLLEDTQRCCEQVRDRGLARLVECATPDLAALIAHDARTRRLCLLAGERHVVVPASSEAAFRRGLRELGYLLADGAVTSATAGQQAEGRRAKGRRTDRGIGGEGVEA